MTLHYCPSLTKLASLGKVAPVLAFGYSLQGHQDSLWYGLLGSQINYNECSEEEEEAKVSLLSHILLHVVSGSHSSHSCIGQPWWLAIYGHLAIQPFS